MTIEEYFKWKIECPNEWEEVRKDTIRNVLVEKFKAHKHHDDIMFESPSASEEERVYTYARVLKALQNGNDCCNDLVRLHKQAIDYGNREKVSRII